MDARGLRPEQIDEIASKYVTSLYDTMEQDVINDIARRVKKTGRFTETAEIMARNMREQGYSTAEIQSKVFRTLNADKKYQNAVAENTREYKQEIKQIIQETVKAAKRAGNSIVAEAGNMAWNDDLQMWKVHDVDLKKDNAFGQLIKAFQEQTAGQLRNITRTTAFNGTSLGTVGIMNAYQRAMDVAVLKTATGTFSFNEAVKSCVKDLSRGLSTVDYASGRRYKLDSAARMAVRTGVSQLAGRISLMNCENSGQDLVYVSEHAGARPEHAAWQGAVYSLSGKSRKYKDFYKETGYGSVTGLKGVNCTHDFYPHWEGDPIPPKLKEPDPVKINGKTYTYYEATQQQRAMERSIRETTRELKAMRAIGENTDELQNRLNYQAQQYAEFSSLAGIRAKTDRLGGAWGEVSKSTRGMLMNAKAGDNIQSIGILDSLGINSKTKGTDNVLERSTVVKFTKEVLGLDGAVIDKIPTDTLNMYNNEINRARELFGDITGKKFLVSLQDEAKVDPYMAYNKALGHMYVRKEELSELADIAREQFEKGHWSTSDAEHGVRHELGHVILEMLITQEKADKINALYKKTIEECGIIDVKNITLEQKEKAKEILSVYGIMKKGDMIAESVAEYMAGNPRKLAQEVVNILQE